MILSFIATALAQPGRISEGGVVPCCDPTLPPGKTPVNICPDGTPMPPCDMNALFSMGETIVNTLIGIGFLIAILFVVVGAFRLIISQGSPEGINQGKANITAAIIGLVIVLVAWVVLNTAINFFVDETRCKREWWRFQGLQCGVIEQPPPAETTS